ncbi:MAG: hydrolase [Cycloclasticus sp. symbiont of Poecilosclerida sp. M]|nr:MAG: hydrolase [Cycloclasticus sp. symbiont of Poecilosclerida sp. M]
MKIKQDAHHPNLDVLERQPKRAVRRPILFIHGANMSAWCWDEHFMPYFSERKHPTYALDLRGHGKSGGQHSLSLNSIADYVDDIQRVIDQIGESPILVGHSLGGLVVQKYIEKNVVPAAVLMASVPVGGLAEPLTNLAFYNPAIYAGLNLSKLFGTWFSPVDVTRESVFSGDVSDDVVIRYCTEVQPSSPKALLDALWLGVPTEQNPFNIPMLALAADEDTFFLPDQIEETAKAYKADFINIKDTSHAMMLDSHWQTTADAIYDWLSAQRLPKFKKSRLL